MRTEAAKARSFVVNLVWLVIGVVIFLAFLLTIVLVPVRHRFKVVEPHVEVAQTGVHGPQLLNRRVQQRDFAILRRDPGEELGHLRLHNGESAGIATGRAMPPLPSVARISATSGLPRKPQALAS